jgi:hypothetical protein
VSWISSSNRQAVWKRAFAKWKAREEPYPLLPAGFQIAKEPSDIGEQQIADLGFLGERRVDLGNGFFKSQCL